MKDKREKLMTIDQPLISTYIFFVHLILLIKL